MSEGRTRRAATGCGFQKADDDREPGWFCVIHQCWSVKPDLCPINRVLLIKTLDAASGDRWAEGYNAALYNARHALGWLDDGERYD